MTEQNPKFFKTVRDDLRRGDFKRTLSQDFKDLKEFYLNKEQKSRLAEMGWVKRSFYMTWWLLKILFFRLTPTRRILFLISVILILFSDSFQWQGEDVSFQSDTNLLGYLIFCFVLMLELKDKLLARDELEAGRAVQHALMPEPSPTVPGWSLWLFTQPANEIGGDLVDFLQLDETRFGVALADVAGKGLGAALFMAKLQATLRAIAPDYDSLSALGQKINAIFFRDTVANSFASLVYLEIAADSQQVRFINAGHMPPVLLHQGQVKETPKGEQALGLAAEAVYKEHILDLSKDDLVLVYSDGLTEAQNARGEFFGEERLMSLLPSLTDLSVEDMGKRVLSEVKRFIGDARAIDDLSLCILKRL